MTWLQDSLRRTQFAPHRLREIAWTAGQGAFLLAFGFFAFQVSQGWVDRGISNTLLRWIFPFAISGGLGVLIGFLFLLRNLQRNPGDSDPVTNLATAILGYARELHRDGRDQALVTLRNNFSLTLHILGFHKIRTQLGELAIQSATILEQDLAKVQILVDDLGWSHHLIDNNKMALANISRGVEIARQARKAERSRNNMDLALWEAKGLRHLALIKCSSNEAEASANLARAREILVQTNQLDRSEVRRDLAQLDHAEALMKATLLHVHKEGRIRDGDEHAEHEVKQALTLVKKSSQVFRELGDRDRYTKALFLEVRLLEALGLRTEALETRGLRDRTLASSEWIRQEGTETITGV